MPEIKTLLSKDADRWDAFVLRHDLGSIYHTSAWRRIIEKTYRHNAYYFFTENGSGEIIAAVPFFAIKNRLTGNRLVSLPAAQACNPLVSNQAEYVRFIDHAVEFAGRRNLNSIEIKTDASFPWDSTKFGKALSGYSRYVLDMDKDLQTLENALHKTSIRGKIKKAGKNDVNLIVGKSLDDVKILYKLYLKMRKEYGLLPQPYKFFATMWELTPPQNIEILHAEYHGQIIASILLLKHKDTVTYEYGATLSEMKKLGPSPFLLWQAIRRAKQDGYKKFDFGRTADDNEGLVRFKQRWGTKREALPYYYIPDFGNGAQIRQNGFSKRLMSYSMQHLPEPVCQFAGSMLYRSFV